MKFKVPCTLFSIALLLQGCMAGVVISSAAIATKSITDPRSFGTQLDDSTLKLRIENILSKDTQLKKYAHIVVIVYQGQVLLIGQAPNANIARRAKQITMSVEGVKEIYNEIRFGMPINISTASSDIWITTKIRLKILTNDAVKSTNVKITTENSEVFLFGVVAIKEAETIAKIASEMRGVKHVTTVFSYVK